MAETTVNPAEFEKIPLDFIIATPLLTTIEAHKQAANTTLEFVKNLVDANNDMKFSVKVKETDQAGVETVKSKDITVPLLALVKVPSLNFDSLSVSFNYNISQVNKLTDTAAQNLDLKISTKGLLSKFVDASLVGSIEHSRTSESTSNRGGSLEIKLHVSESKLPAGLEKIINALVEGIDVPK